MQPELVQYYHAASGFLIKPSLLEAIKNKQYTSWPGLTWEAANKHYLKSKETLKGHGHKTRSGLQSTKTTTESDNKDNNKNAKATHLPRLIIKQKEAIIKVYNLSDKAQHLIYTNQTGFGNIKLRSPVHHGANQDWQQCNPRGSNEEPHIRGDDPSISGGRRAPSQRGSYSEDAHPRQLVLSRIQGKNQAQQHEVPARTSTQPQAEYRWKSDSILQGILHKVSCAAWTSH